MKDLEQVYRTPSLDVAETALEQLEDRWNTSSPFAVASWQYNWSKLSIYEVALISRTPTMLRFSQIPSVTDIQGASAS